MRTFAISDIHGHLDELNEMIKKIQLNKEDVLVVMGDNIDRGPNSMGTVLKLLSLKEKGYNVITLRGNHEDMFLSVYKNYKNIDEVYGCINYEVLKHNGTLSSLIEFFSLDETDRKKVIREMKSYRYYYVKEEYLFVHAGVFPHLSLKEQQEDYFMWVREEFINTVDHGLPYVVIFGHTPTRYMREDMDDKIFHSYKKIGIDCGAAFGGNLACLDITTHDEYYVKT